MYDLGTFICSIFFYSVRKATFMSSLMFLYLKKLSQSLRFVSNQYSAKADTHTFMSLTQDSLTHSLLCINKLKYDSVSQCMLLYLPAAPPPSSVVPSVLPQNQHLALQLMDSAALESDILEFINVFSLQVSTYFQKKVQSKIKDLLQQMEEGLKTADPHDFSTYTGWTGLSLTTLRM